MEVAQCNHPELRGVLEFFVPFINPNKPKRMTIQVASTVVDCLIHKTKISWAKVFEYPGIGGYATLCGHFLSGGLCGQPLCEGQPPD
jgi:hypothetical protein